MPGKVPTVSTGMMRGARPRGRRGFPPDEKGRRAEKCGAVEIYEV